MTQIQSMSFVMVNKSVSLMLKLFLVIFYVSKIMFLHQSHMIVILRTFNKRCNDQWKSDNMGI